MSQHSTQQRDNLIAFAFHHVAELMCQGERAKCAHGIDEKRMRPVERWNVAFTVAEIGPSARLHGAGAAQRQVDIFLLPGIPWNPPLTDQSSKISIGANLIEAVIVNTEMRDMGGHIRANPLDRQVEKASFSGRVELQNGAAEFKSLGPVGPAARL